MITIPKFTIAKVDDHDPQGVILTEKLLKHLAVRHGELKAGYYLQKNSRKSFQAYDISHFTSMPELEEGELRCTLVIADTPRGKLLQEAYHNNEVDFRVICDIDLVDNEGNASISGIKYIMAIDHDMKSEEVAENN